MSSRPSRFPRGEFSAIGASMAEATSTPDLPVARLTKKRYTGAWRRLIATSHPDN
jgi:hypothetical protein